MKGKTFGTFTGVFTPTTLTILGVIMYIRLPWVVGNAGIVGALAIVFLAVAITFTTALSISSITTNIRIGEGGAFSVISQSLGLEIGGAIGIPFYLAQAIAVSMYVFGFREGLQSIFQNYDPFLLDIYTFVLVMTIAFISTSFAFKIQYIILGIVALSLICIYGSLFTHHLNNHFEWFGKYPGSPEDNFSGTSFWTVFAVFFPAVTGVMAGANMSGDLTDPGKNIPRGTLSSLIITTIIYLSLIFVAALISTPDNLVKNYNVFIDQSLFPPLVLTGLLGATLSSALGSFVGAPRILLALGERTILPKSKFISKISKRGEPVNAMLITAVIVIFGISLRDLNTIAPLLTMFFVITYAMVNVVAFIEQFLGLPSYRPLLKIPIIIPLIGAIGSLTVMFIINAFVALLSLILIITFYFYLVRKHLVSTAGDSRSGLFTALAEWATKKTTELSPRREARSWRPDLLVPVIYPAEIRSSFQLINSIIYPKGSLKLMAIRNEDAAEQKRLNDFMILTIRKFKEMNIPISATTVDNYDFSNSMNISMQSLNAAFFKPNTIFIGIDPGRDDIEKYNTLLVDTKKNSYGLIFFIPYGTSGISMEKNVSLWINNLPAAWKENFNLHNNDLAILLSLLISKNWKGHINVHIIKNDNIVETDLLDLKEMIRFPKDTAIQLNQGNIIDEVFTDINSDLNIISISNEMDIQKMIAIVNRAKISAIFCNDSGLENALV